MGVNELTSVNFTADSDLLFCEAGWATVRKKTGGKVPSFDVVDETASINVGEG
jgi:hypothetical protein